MNRRPTLGIGFAAFQDGTFEVFVQNRETGSEWMHTGTFGSEAEVERLREVFTDCVIVSAESALSRIKSLEGALREARACIADDPANREGNILPRIDAVLDCNP